MNPQEPPLLSAKDGHVLRLTVNRPERRNALTGEVLQKLVAELAKAEGDPDIRAIVLTGAGEKAFSGGADLKPDTDYSPIKMQLEHLNHPVVDVFRAVERLTKPLIARMRAYAVKNE